MNMMTTIEPENDQDKRLQGPQTARGRLYEWSRVRHWHPINVWPPESPIYAILKSPGRATDTAGDGGMASFMDRLARQPESHAMRVRSLEVQAAVDVMPKAYRSVVRCMYEVERRERPRDISRASEMAGMKEPNFRKTMDMALAWLQGRLDLHAVRGPQDLGVDAT